MKRLAVILMVSFVLANLLTVFLPQTIGMDTTPSWTSSGDDQAYAYFGYSVANASDVNGDGYSDVVIGAFSYDTSNYDAGKAYLYLGAYDYTPHDPIYINGNGNFTFANGVTGGNGTQTNPYIIEDWNISASSAIGIRISDTDAYFIIRNCYVHDGGLFHDGIFFYNVTNGRVENTILSNNLHGICLADSDYNIILNNSASGNIYGIDLSYSGNNTIFNNSANSNSYFGIDLGFSSYNNIFNNSASNNILGIWLGDSSNNNVFNNSANSNGYLGIFLNSTNNNVFNNSASSNGQVGIFVGPISSNNSIFNNSVNSNNFYGIAMSSSSNNNIFNNSVNSNNYYGIYIDYSSNNNISNNSASNNWIGIGLIYSSYNNVFNNSANSNYYYGICLVYSINSTLGNNTFENDGIVIGGDGVEHFNTHNIDTTNTANGKPIYYYKNRNDIVIDGWSAGQVILANCTNFTVNNVNCSNASIGVELAYCDYCLIENSAFDNGANGICLMYSDYNNIYNNSAYLNNYDAIYLESSSYNTFVSSDIFYNSRSVEIYDSNCENNTFHHNNFINGSVVNVIDNGLNTKWDDGYGEGNYWSNYTGLDNGTGGRVAGDGVGDTNIPHMGLDNYPLMDPVEQPYTPDITPPVISSVIVSELTETSATITWTTDEFSDSRVNYSVSDDLSSNSTEYNSTLTISHSITLTGLNPETPYYFEVSSTDVYGNTATDTNNSNYYTFTTLGDTTPPATPTGLTITDVPNDEGGALNITWNANTEPDLDHYTLYSNKTGSWTVVTDIPAGTEYYVDTGLTDGARYYYNISASDDASNESPQSATASDVPEDNLPPVAPTGLTAQDHPNDEGGAIDLNWNDNTEPDLDHYNIYRSTTQGGAYTKIGETTTSDYTDSTTTDGITYYYVVTACDEVPNESGYSNEASASSLDNLPPATPTGLVATSLRSGDLNITWNLNTDDTQTYSIYSNKTGTWTLLMNITHPQNSYVDTGLTSGTTYYYRISAWDEDPQESSKSEAVYGVSSPMGTISGTVEDKDSNPIEGATVTIYESGTTTDPVASTTTDSNGEYSVDVPPGTYDVKIEKSGYDVQWEKDVVVIADQTTTADSTLPLISLPTTDILGDYWWLILLVIIVIIIIVALIVKKKKPVEVEEEEKPVEATEEEE